MDKSQVWDKYIAMEVVKFLKKNRSGERERERELFGGFIIRGEENVRMSSLKCTDSILRSCPFHTSSGILPNT